MGVHIVRIIVKMKVGSKVVGATITAYNSTALFKGIKNWRGGTDLDGICTFNNLDNGRGDKYDFQAYFVDDSGTNYYGAQSDKILHDVDITIILTESLPNVSGTLYISNEMVNTLQEDEDGRIILSAIKEMQVAVTNNLPHASIALSTYILEGLIKREAKKKGVWAKEFDNYSYGQLVNEKKLEQLFLKEELAKVKGLNAYRIPAVHFKNVKSVIAEAQVGIGIIGDLIRRWVGQVSS